MIALREMFGVNNSCPTRALDIGKAAEYIVCADLLLKGYRAFPSDQGLPYDIVVDVEGRLIRLQVKATMGPKKVPDTHHTKKYLWHVRRAGKGNSRRIDNDEFDVLALVALDIKVAAYLPISDRVLQTVALRPPGIARGNRASIEASFRRCVDEYSFAEALSELGI